MINIFTKELNIIFESYKCVAENGLYISLFIFALLYLFIHLREKNKSIKTFLEIYPIVILLIIWNPLFTKILINFIGETVYWRVYWLLPIGFILAYVFTRMIFKLEERYKKALASLAIFIIIFMSGEFIYTSKWFKKVDNYFKVPDHALEMIFIISEDDEEEKAVAGPTEILVYTRQINGNIKVAEDRNVYGIYEDDSVINRINRGEVAEIAELAIKNDWNYIVYPNSVTLQDDPENYGLVKLAENATYTLYKFY